MFTAFEWYFLASMGYPIASAAYVFAKKDTFDSQIVAKKCTELQMIEFYARESNYNAPIYVGNQYAKIPVGGGSYSDWREVGRGARIVESSESVQDLHKYNVVIGSKQKFPIDTNYANHYENLVPLLESYNLKNKIPISIPMRIDSYKVPGPTIYFDAQTCLLDNNRSALLREKMFQKRLPLTILVPSVALTAFLFLHFIKADSSHWCFVQPPTDILGKLTGNTAEKRWRETYRR